MHQAFFKYLLHIVPKQYSITVSEHISVLYLGEYIIYIVNISKQQIFTTQTRTLTEIVFQLLFLQTRTLYSVYNKTDEAMARVLGGDM